MDELVAQIAQNTGVEPAVARKAVGIILNFLKKQGPADKVEALVSAVPGAKETMAEVGGGGGMLGIMGVFTELTGIGLGMGNIQGVAKELIGFARAKVGSETVDEVVGSIPGLSQFV
jgi:Cu/Ag efflux pump CusA